jgi:NADH:ubiquinone oxidoreductase subunit E
MIRRITLVAAGVIAVCVAVLSADYALARFREPRDDARIAALQQQVRTDAARAPTLEAEHKRITDTRRARKIRIEVLSYVLMAAAAAFLTGAKKQWGGTPVPRGTATSRQTAGLAAGLRVWKPAPQVSEDFTVVDEIIAREGRTREAAIPILQAIQAHFRYLPDDALRRVCELTEITPAEISGTSSFYSRFRRSPVGEHIVRVCHGTACHVSGARQITDELRRGLAIPNGADTDPSRRFTLEEVACLGCCSLAPVMMVDEKTVGKLTPAGALDALG